ncbi:hypothetical protein B0J11DRAFT_510731 [Dendryphion nanum]|uniref:Uncharacterized protein n=1 Tax=Dendryphion nanum TaxID=256645 RepID=A0A9P9D7H6_9PLEO|nr:hypothetical protein B0J11DRAFT_510731 [Dendryphion nanum]
MVWCVGTMNLLRFYASADASSCSLHHPAIVDIATRSSLSEFECESSDTSLHRGSVIDVFRRKYRGYYLDLEPALFIFDALNSTTPHTFLQDLDIMEFPLDGFPEELLLCVFRQLKPIRRFTCLDPSDPELYLHGRIATAADIARLEENQKRIKCLVAITRVSKKYQRVCRPILFSSLIVDKRVDSARDTSTKFLRSILETPELQKYVEYVENNVKFAKVYCDLELGQEKPEMDPLFLKLFTEKVHSMQNRGSCPPEAWMYKFATYQDSIPHNGDQYLPKYQTYLPSCGNDRNRL